MTTHPLDLSKSRVEGNAKIVKLFSCSCFTYCNHGNIYAADSKGTFYSYEKDWGFEKLYDKLDAKRLCSTKSGVVSLSESGKIEPLDSSDYYIGAISHLEGLLCTLNEGRKNKLKIIDVFLSTKYAVLLNDGSAVITTKVSGLADSDSYTITPCEQHLLRSDVAPASTVIEHKMLQSTKGEKATKIIEYNDFYRDAHQNTFGPETILAVHYDNSKEVKVISLKSGKMSVLKFPDIIQEVRNYQHLSMVSLRNNELWCFTIKDFIDAPDNSPQPQLILKSEPDSLWSRNEEISGVANSKGVIEAGCLYAAISLGMEGLGIEQNPQFDPKELRANLPHRVTQVCTVTGSRGQAAMFLMENGEVATAVNYRKLL